MKTTDATARAKTATKKAESKIKATSAYGATIEAVCMNPDASKEEILKAVLKAGIDVENNKNAVYTGICQAKKVISLLRSNNQMA